MKPIRIWLTAWIYRLQWVVMLLAVPFFLLINPRHSLVLIVVPVLWGITWWVTRKPLPKTPLNLPLLLVMLMVMVSLFATYDITLSLPSIAGIVLGMGLYYAFVNSAHAEKGVGVVLPVFLVCELGVASLSLLGTNWIIKFNFLQSLLSRLPSLVKGLPGVDSGLHPNVVAGALLWVLPLMGVGVGWTIFCLPWLARRLGWRWVIAGTFLLFGAFFFTAGVFFLTQSRSGMIGLAGGLLLMLVMLFKHRWRWIYIASLGILIVGLGVLAWQTGWIQKLDSASSINTNNALSLITFNTRVEIWIRAIHGIQDSPFIGMGMNTFGKVAQMFYPIPGLDIPHADNEFLQVALDLGIPALIAYLSLYLCSFWMLINIWDWTETDPLRMKEAGGLNALLNTPGMVKALVLGLGGGLLAHALFGLTDATVLVTKPGFLFWMLLGLITGLYQERRRIRLSND